MAIHRGPSSRVGRSRNDFAPGNAGYYFLYDIVVPLALITLYVVTR